MSSDQFWSLGYTMIISLIHFVILGYVVLISRWEWGKVGFILQAGTYELSTTFKVLSMKE